METLFWLVELLRNTAPPRPQLFLANTLPLMVPETLFSATPAPASELSAHALSWMKLLVTSKRCDS